MEGGVGHITNDVRIKEDCGLSTEWKAARSYSGEHQQQLGILFIFGVVCVSLNLQLSSSSCAEHEQLMHSPVAVYHSSISRIEEK